MTALISLQVVGPALTNIKVIPGGGGIPFRIVVNGVTYERLQDDLTGQFLFDDLTNQPLYDRVA